MCPLVLIDSVHMDRHRRVGQHLEVDDGRIVLSVSYQVVDVLLLIIYLVVVEVTEIAASLEHLT